MSFWEKVRQKFAEGNEDSLRDTYRHALSDEEKADIEQMAADGMTVGAIAQELKRPYKTVHGWIQKQRAPAGTPAQAAPSPLQDARTQIELVKLDIERTRLQMEGEDLMHKRELQKLELELKAETTKAEIELKRIELQQELNGGEDDDDESEGAEGMLMSILEKALSRPPTTDGNSRASHTESATTAGEPGYTVSVYDAARASIPAAAAAPAASSPGDAQLAQLAEYVRAQGWDEERTVAEAVKRGRTDDEARQFYAEYIAPSKKRTRQVKL